MRWGTIHLIRSALHWPQSRAPYPSESKVFERRAGAIKPARQARYTRLVPVIPSSAAASLSSHGGRSVHRVCVEGSGLAEGAAEVGGRQHQPPPGLEGIRPQARCCPGFLLSAGRCPDLCPEVLRDWEGGNHLIGRVSSHRHCECAYPCLCCCVKFLPRLPLVRNYEVRMTNPHCREPQMRRAYPSGSRSMRTSHEHIWK